MSIYLDNAATSYPKPEEVYQAVMNAMREVGASPGRGGHRRSLEAGRIVFQAREAAAALFCAPDSSRFIFTHSATESLNMALRGTLLPGDHVITTSMEHNSLARPLHLLQRQGVELTVVQAGPDGRVDPVNIRRVLTPRTRMIAVGHVSNVSGTIQPIEALSAIAREAGALFLLDAAQSAGCVPIDVIGSGIDLMAVPGHKGLYGPQGTGLLYVAPHVALRPLLTGGTGTNSTSEEQPVTMPEGFEAGTHNLPGIAGLKAGIEFVMKQGVAAIADHERALVCAARERLQALAGVTLYGPSDPVLRAAVLSFTIAGKDSSWVAFELDQRFDIAVRAGLHCAPRAHRTLGTFPGGTVRVSPGWFTSLEDIAMLVNAVEKCL
ncbi:MAG: aminotransferase class V-fold PLP-dependent enzyme [Desulfuromonadales bacterium]|nr:aminotransferase class V-fold PLP-dependent enzyme [Desulfuromonadales bacterium]